MDKVWWCSAVVIERQRLAGAGVERDALRAMQRLKLALSLVVDAQLLIHAGLNVQQLVEA